MCTGEKEPSHKAMLYKARCRGYLMVRYTTDRGVTSEGAREGQGIKMLSCNIKDINNNRNHRSHLEHNM